MSKGRAEQESNKYDVGSEISSSKSKCQHKTAFKFILPGLDWADNIPRHAALRLSKRHKNQRPGGCAYIPADSSPNRVIKWRLLDPELRGVVRGPRAVTSRRKTSENRHEADRHCENPFIQWRPVERVLGVIWPVPGMDDLAILRDLLRAGNTGCLPFSVWHGSVFDRARCCFV